MTDTSNISTGVASAVAAVKADLPVVEAEYGFVRANWGKLSTIVVGAGTIGFLIGFLL